MISVEQALAILHDNIPEPVKERVLLTHAYDCRISEDIFAPEPSPRYTNSAMDGFAVSWEDCQGASKDSPISLEIIGESQAGIPYQSRLRKGGAIRISTGAMLPEGADTVVRVEDTVENGRHVGIMAVNGRGQDVRYQGEEFQKGELLFSRTTRLRARELALLASVGVHTVAVFMPPRVSLLITGTELAQFDDEEIKAHQIRDSNTIMLESAIKDSGAVVRCSNHVEDNLADTIQAIARALQKQDSVILCSGGVSVGRHDHVKDAATEVGFKELFWKIRQKPGKPLFVGRKENVLLFGLPGNPVSAYMCFRNYVRPVLAELQGTQSLNHTVTARATQRISNPGSRTNFIRVVVENRPNEIAQITEISRQGSHMLSSIVHADGYIVLGPGQILEPG
ncbi:MAG: molybdopterin molybdotransferase MoeA, partial [Desulfofustis sp.]